MVFGVAGNRERIKFWFATHGADLQMAQGYKMTAGLSRPIYLQ